MAPLAAQPSDFGGTERFAIRRLLGEGSYGAVYEVHDRARDAVVAARWSPPPTPGWPDSASPTRRA